MQISIYSGIGLLTLLYGCGRQPPVVVEKAPRPVRTRVAETSVCSVATGFSGNVEPLARVQLAFKRGGYVSSILHVKGGAGQRLVEQGDRIRHGSVLARLRDADYRVKLEQAKAQLAQAQVTKDQTRQDFERSKHLYDSQAVSLAAFEGAASKATAAEAQAQAAAAQVEEARLALEDCVLRAPSTAVLSKRLIEVGALVAAGMPAFALADTTSMKVIFGVPDILLDRIRVGVELQVSIEALGSGPMVGRVASIAPIADPKNRLFDVEILLPNADGRLRAGMVASLRMQQPQPRLVVPMTALVRPPGRSDGFAVFVAEGNVLRVRPIEPGEVCAGHVEILSGLAASEQVVAEGAAQAFDGERIAIVGGP